MTVESVLSPFIASDGENLAIQDWPDYQGERLRGVVLLVHGLGEHAGRYEVVASQLNAWGFAVRGYDQYGHGESGGPRGGLPSDARLLNTWGFAVRGYDQYGHGESGGPRGGLPSDARLLDDLADIVDTTRARMPPDTPLILLGHSLGGLVAARFVSLALRPVDALVLSSPALDPGLNAFQRFLIAVLPKIAPNLRVGNGLDASLISHDPAVVAAYLADPLVHDRISGRLARFIADAGPATVALASQWQVPTLLLYAGADKLVNPAGSRAFVAQAQQQVVTARCFDDLYHEIFNELQPEPVFAALKQWLHARF